MIMNENIKQILEQSLDYEFDLTFKQRKELLDYITNLQDTLKDREEYCYGLETQIINLQEENKHLNDLLENALKSYEYERDNK